MIPYYVYAHPSRFRPLTGRAASLNSGLALAFIALSMAWLMVLAESPEKTSLKNNTFDHF